MENSENKNKRQRIGFKYWNNDDENFIIEDSLTVEPMEQINNNISIIENGKVVLTVQHKEVLTRLEMVENIILSKGFSEYSKEKKKEFLDEQNFLKQINDQLILTY